MSCSAHGDTTCKGGVNSFRFDDPEASTVIFSDNDWGVQAPPKRIVFRFHETILRRARIPRFAITSYSV